jgi:hypothetical protein
MSCARDPEPSHTQGPTLVSLKRTNPWDQLIHGCGIPIGQALDRVPERAEPFATTKILVRTPEWDGKGIAMADGLWRLGKVIAGNLTVFAQTREKE